MLSTGNGAQLTMPVTPAYNSVGNDGMFGDGSWWIIILFLFIFAGWGGNGFGGGSSGAAENYVLASDFATLQRQIDSAALGLRQQSTAIADGICSLGYDQLGQFNNVNTNVLTQSNATNTALLNGFNGISSQLASMSADQSQCCCATQRAIDGINYNLATSTCAINTNNSNNTRDIIDAQNASTQAILAKLNEQEMNAKNAQISALEQQVNSLQLAASQVAQNQYLVSELRPSPTPAYVVANPYCNCSYSNCNCG